MRTRVLVVVTRVLVVTLSPGGDDTHGGIARRLQALLVDDALQQASAVIVVEDADRTRAARRRTRRLRTVVGHLRNLSPNVAKHVRFLIRDPIETMRRVVPGQMPRHVLDVRALLAAELPWLVPARCAWQSQADLLSWWHYLGDTARQGCEYRGALREMLASVSQDQLMHVLHAQACAHKLMTATTTMGAITVDYVTMFLPLRARACSCAEAGRTVLRHLRHDDDGHRPRNRPRPRPRAVDGRGLRACALLRRRWRRRRPTGRLRGSR